MFEVVLGGDVDIWIFGCIDNEGKGIHRKK